MSAIEQWKSRVREHTAQSVRVQGGQEPPGDFWRPYAPRFRTDPCRTDDAVVTWLLREVRPEDTVLDVGGGGGRFALPLALRCRHVTVVESSESMVEVLRQGMHEARVLNLTVVVGRWEEVEVDPAEAVLCAHVLYGVEDVEPFVRKLETHARDRVLILMFTESPQAHLSPLWERAHGEARLVLPGLRELLDVLWEMDIYPDLEMLAAQPLPAFETWEEAQQELRRRLYVVPDTEKDRGLDEAMQELLEKRQEGFVVRGTGPRHLGILTWRPR